MKLFEEQIQFYKEYGYLHLKNFFSQDEIASFKRGCDLNEYGDTLVRKDFLEFSISDKVLDIVRQLLGSDVIIYPGLSQTRTDDKCEFGDRYYHVDSHPDDRDYSCEYTVLNTGIYLQDHLNLSGGLKIKPGSHKYDCIEIKSVREYVKELIKCIMRFDLKVFYTLLRRSYSKNIATVAGDFLIWNMRTHHTGYFVRIRGLSNLSLSPIIENLVPKFLAKQDPACRRVVLSAYASPGNYTELWLANQAKKDRRKNHYAANSKLNQKYYQDLFISKNIIYRNDAVKKINEI